MPLANINQNYYSVSKLMLSIYEHIPPCGMSQKKYWRQLLINGGDQLLKNNPDRKKKSWNRCRKKTRYQCNCVLSSNLETSCFRKKPCPPRVTLRNYIKYLFYLNHQWARSRDCC